MNNDASPSPVLAPPGAGLPAPELFFARLLFGCFRRSQDRSAVGRLLGEDRDRVLALVRPLPPETAARRVLIDRLRGMEDSSRFWSPWMTVEHLRIVNGAVAATMAALLKGDVPARKASTADVKPGACLGADCVDGFEESCRAIERVVASASDLRTRAKFAHPWFGPLDAAGWHAMAAFHMRLHRKQIEAILRS